MFLYTFRYVVNLYLNNKGKFNFICICVNIKIEYKLPYSIVVISNNVVGIKNHIQP